jgi:hypothetical protein
MRKTTLTLLPLLWGGMLTSWGLADLGPGAGAQAAPSLPGPSNTDLLVTQLSASTQYETYTNETFGFRVTYPSDLLVPNSPITLEQGRVFISPVADITMVVYGQPQVDGQLEQLYEDTLYMYRQRGAELSQTLLGENKFVVVGYHPKGVMFLTKMLQANDSFITLGIIYDNDSAYDLQTVVAEIAETFQVVPQAEAPTRSELPLPRQTLLGRIRP